MGRDLDRDRLEALAALLSAVDTLFPAAVAVSAGATLFIVAAVVFGR